MVEPGKQRKKDRTGNGERGTGNGEQGTGNRKMSKLVTHDFYFPIANPQSPIANPLSLINFQW